MMDSKGFYIGHLLGQCRVSDKRLGEAAIYFYHAGIPLEEACIYIANLAAKFAEEAK